MRVLHLGYASCCHRFRPVTPLTCCPCPVANIRLGDRSTERKASFEAPLCFASPFMSVHGPGVVSVDASDALQVGAAQLVWVVRWQGTPGPPGLLTPCALRILGQQSVCLALTMRPLHLLPTASLPFPTTRM